LLVLFALVLVSSVFLPKTFSVEGEIVKLKSLNVVAGRNTVSVGSVDLQPGNYYIAIGCATTCNNAVSSFTSTAVAIENGATIPPGKRAYEGTVTMASGICDATPPHHHRFSKQNTKCTPR